MVDEQSSEISNDSGKLDVSKILMQVPNHFLLAVAVAKRARQLQDLSLIHISEPTRPY